MSRSRPRTPRLRMRQLPPRPGIRPPATTPDVQQSTATPPTPSSHIGRICMTPLRGAFSWYQRVDWGKHTTVFAALVAAVGLGLTAWGTLMSARVAADQLDQSQEQRTERSMSQASRITAWAEGDNTVVANRSLDPADVYLAATVAGSTHQTRLSAEPQRDFVYVGTVPPCLRLSIPGDMLRSTLHDTGHILFDPKNPGPIYVTSIMIVDSNGHVWERGNGSPLGPVADHDAKFAVSFAMARMSHMPLFRVAPDRAVTLASTPAVKTKGLEECGSGT